MTNNFRFRTAALLAASIFLASCANAPPKNPDNICYIFMEYREWYVAAKDMKDKWGTPIHVPMAMMYQESSFKHDAAPPMEYFWFIPTGRASDAYGYPQAKDMTWKEYKEETGNSWASRANFADAIDFIGWFTNKTERVNEISKWDAYNQYLNYHEGNGGFKAKSFDKKPWLIKVARKVEERSKLYAGQLKTCENQLGSTWLWRLFFA